MLKYTDEWREYVTRQARWVDFDHDYKTLNPDYMESVIWAFKTLYDKGYVYEGFRVLPYCWNDQTPLSNHELRMDDDVYQMRQDPAVTVGVRLETGELALVWTTTPWTLPSNLAVMVHPDIDYVVVETDVPTGRLERYVIGAERLASYARDLFGDAKADVESFVVERLTGRDLLGRSYTPPFSYYEGHENAHRVVEADFVTTTDGTGLVHSAGAFGEDDKVVTDREGIEPVMPVGPDGRFTYPVSEYEGMLVFDANLPIIDDLKAATRGDAAHGAVTEGTVLVRRETYDHSYPHCWRCRQPLIYKAVSSWFVEVTKFKDRMLELNEQIQWVPDHIKHGQFGKWLANARDWSISRNRFWGSPIPVWKSDNPEYPRIDVYGSFEELEKDFGVSVDDLHRPFIDRLTRPNPDDPTGQSTMRRVEDVLDVWFDSGSMSFAQVHYPFENADWFEHHFPGDFIVEYIGQTRGWFYTLHILATALFDRPAFSACVSHGIVLGSDGQKMSKSLRNYPDVRDVFNRDGADAMRWFLMSSPILRGGNLVVTEQGIRDGVRQVIIPLWNTWYFFSLYANAAGDGQGGEGKGYQAKWSTASTDPLDRYLLAKLGQFVQSMQDQLDEYEVAGACETTRGFLDVLTNWYVRRSRERFWDTGEGAGAEQAFDTLYTALEVVCRVAAPLLPLLTEDIWRGPDRWALGAPDRLARRVRPAPRRRAGGGHGPRPRDLLGRLVAAQGERAAGAAAAAGPHRGDGGRGVAEGLRGDHRRRGQRAHGDPARHQRGQRGRLRCLPAADRQRPRGRPAAGPRRAAGHQGQQVRRLVRGGRRHGDGRRPGAGRGRVHPRDGRRRRPAGPGGSGATRTATAMLPGGGFVVLDTEVTSELAQEGLARDIVRAVQQARRDAGLDVSDRISLTVTGGEDVWQATHRPPAAHHERDPGHPVRVGRSARGAAAALGRRRGDRRRRRAGADQGDEALSRSRPPLPVVDD